MQSNLLNLRLIASFGQVLKRFFEKSLDYAIKFLKMPLMTRRHNLLLSNHIELNQ